MKINIKKERLWLPFIAIGMCIIMYGTFHCYECPFDPCIPINIYCFIFFLVPGAVLTVLGNILIFKKSD